MAWTDLRLGWPGVPLEQSTFFTDLTSLSLSGEECLTLTQLVWSTNMDSGHHNYNFITPTWLCCPVPRSDYADWLCLLVISLSSHAAHCSLDDGDPTQVRQSDDVPAQCSAPDCLPCTLQPTLTECTVVYSPVHSVQWARSTYVHIVRPHPAHTWDISDKLLFLPRTIIREL